MKRSLREAIENLKAFRIKNITNKELEHNIETKTRGKIPVGKTEDLLNKTLDLEVYFKPVEIYWLLKVYYETLKSKKLKPSSYFEDIEIAEFENYSIPAVASGKDRTFVLHNVKKVSDYIYHCYKCDFNSIKEAYEEGITGYDYSTQRQAKMIMRNGVAILRATVINRNVEAIEKEMLEGNFTPNTLTWNILNNGKEEMEYDEATETLTITRSTDSIVSIIDGYHRTLAIIKALEKGREIRNDFMYITVLNYSVDEAQRYIRQEQQGTKLTVNQQNSFKNDIYVTTAKKINNDKTEELNYLKNKVSITHPDEVYKYNTKLVTLSTLADTLQMAYGDILTKPRDMRKISEWVVDFMNEIIAIKEDDFSNIKKSRLESVVTTNNMICAFINLSRYFYDNRENWEDNIEKILNNTNFSIENSFWTEKLIKTHRWDKRIKKMVKDVSNELLNSLN